MIISEVKAAMDLVKQAVGLLHEEKAPNPKLVETIEELRLKVLELYESDINLRLQVRELEEKLNARESVFFDQAKGVYYTGTPEAPKGGPFCAACYHAGKGLVPMQATRRPVWGTAASLSVAGTAVYADIWKCPSCDSKLTR